MSNGLAHQRVLRTVRLLPQAVKIGILESEIKQSGAKPQDPKSARPDPIKSQPPQPKAEPSKVQVKMPPPNAREIEELSAKVKELTARLSDAEVENAELSEAKSKLEGEIGGIKSDYERRRKQLEDEAKNNADRIAEKARTQAMSEGQVKGYEEGLKKARTEVEQEYFEKFSELAGVIDGVGKKLEADFAELVKLNQPRLIRVWTEMLRRMLHRQVELNPDTIDSVLAELLSRLSDKNQILIYVSPDDIKHVEANVDTKFREALRGVKKLELKSDPNIENGSCIVETGLGVYDARWKTQMGQVEAVVDEVFQQSAKEDK
ncbi:MAG: hypothetical protein IJU07_07920 [Synergistaceae bacterium]|nr:hypothetical protein [Synergistaceae bacterium]